jgi:hypothetical protein
MTLAKMKRILIILLVSAFGKVYSQQPAMINENFHQKMMDFNLAWTDFDMPTKINDREGRFSAFQCKYYSDAKPAKPSECSKGLIQIEVSKSKYVPYFEFPELPTCSVLKLGIQAGDKGKVCGIAIQRLENDSWIQIDETEIDARAKCIFWEPKNIKSDSPIKFRLVANKSGSVFLTDVYAEGF